MIKSFSGEYIDVRGLTYFWFQVPNYTYYFVGSLNAMEGPTMLESRYTENQTHCLKVDLLGQLIKEKEYELESLKKLKSQLT